MDFFGFGSRGRGQGGGGGGPVFPGTGNRRIDVFQRQYRVYTGAYIGKTNLDDGGKIILPPSALDELARLHVVYPMLFSITNPTHNITTHCGVLEFSGEEGHVYIPYWMLQHLRLQPGQIVTVRSATLPKGTYVKIRPQTKDFIEISDPKAVLEAKLRNFSCLTKGDTIMIEYINRQYCIDIMEVASSSAPGTNAITIVEADVQVDFERPADMPPSPERPPPNYGFPTTTAAASSSSSSSGPGLAFGKKEDTTAAAVKKEEPKEPEKPAFTAFTGTGRRLDGKKVTDSPSPSPSPAPTATASSSSSSAGARPSGLVFGGGSSTANGKSVTPAPSASSSSASTGAGAAAAKKKEPEPEPKKEEKKFVAFSGQGRSLRG